MAEYIVKAGDTLGKIASQNKTTVQDLASLNKIADVNKIGVGQKINLTLPQGTGNSLSTSNLAPTQNINVTQPQVATGATTLTSDIISKGQADTARAVAEEARIAQQQGTKAPTATENVLKNILSSGTTTPAPQPTQTSTAPINVGGVTADTMASQRQGIQDTLSNIQGETRLTADQYAGTVDPAKAELNTINAMMNDEALAGRRRIEALQSMPGVTKESIQDTLVDTQRRNASNLADLAVVQMAKQGQYDSAKEIADRAVQAKVEDQKNKLNALMFTYTENKELFTKAEQRQFEQAQDDRKRKLDAEEKNLQRISDLSIQALQDGAPTSVVTKMRNAKTEAEAIALGGSYIGALDRAVKKANIAQSNASIAKLNREAQIESGGNTNTANLQAYANEFNQTGKVPSATDLAKAGVTVAQVTQYAKQLPKQTGAVLDKNTGVKPSNVSAAQQDGMQALYDVRTKLARMQQLDKVRNKGLVGGTLSKIFGTDIETEYNALREESIGLISKARSGLTLTATEAKRYENMIPGRFSNTLGLGSSSEKKLKTLDESITGTLNTQLAGNNAVINGYSQTAVPGLGSVVIGSVVDIGGTQYRVLSDGTLTDIIQ